MWLTGLRPRRVAGLIACCSIGVGVLGLFSPAGQAAEGRPSKITPSNHRAGNGPVIRDDAAYEYAPTVMFENGKYRMWECAQVPGSPVKGDDILYSESDSPDGPFHAPGSSKPYVISFHGTGGNEFDGQHTCDPSVVKAGDTYYLYYGAAVHDGETSIGVASSKDGIHWDRVPGGPIVTASHQKNTGNKYGAGQPSAVFMGGKYYMMFTDTTGAGTVGQGAGQFFWRSADPTFRNGTDVYTGSGWQPRTDANSRSFSIANAFSADIQYSDQLKSWIVAHDNDPGHTTLTFLDNAQPKAQPYPEVNIDGRFAEGPGIVSTPDKHSVPGPACNKFPVDVIHADHQAPNNGPPQELRHYGIDLTTDEHCGGTSPSPTHGGGTHPSSPTAAPSHSSAAPSHGGVKPTSSQAGGAAGGSGGLPVTGANIGLAAAIGAALLAAGAGLYLLARRRRAVGQR